MFDLKDAEIKDEEAEVMSLRTQTVRKFDPWKQNGVCWIPDT